MFLALSPQAVNTAAEETLSKNPGFIFSVFTTARRKKEKMATRCPEPLGEEGPGFLLTLPSSAQFISLIAGIRL